MKDGDQTNVGDQTWNGAARGRCSTSTSSFETETCKPYCSVLLNFPKTPVACSPVASRAQSRHDTAMCRAANLTRASFCTTVVTGYPRRAHTLAQNACPVQAPTLPETVRGLANILPPSILVVWYHLRTPPRQIVASANGHRTLACTLYCKNLSHRRRISLASSSASCFSTFLSSRPMAASRGFNRRARTKSSRAAATSPPPARAAALL